MPRPFDEWVSLFSALSGVAATLLGLAFVTFQLRSWHWKGQPLKQAVALTTLTELAAPMIFGLIFMFPGHPYRTAGYIVGAAGYAVAGGHLLIFIRHRAIAERFDWAQLGGTAVILTTFSILTWAPDIRWKAGVLVWMIFSGASEAWLFLRPGEIDEDAARTDRSVVSA